MARKPADNSKNICGFLVVEAVPELAKVAGSFLPLIKSHKWVKKANELVMKHPRKSQIISRRLGRTDFAVTYVIYERAKKICKFINQNDLQMWKLKETDLRSMSLQNLRNMLHTELPNSTNAFQETQTGLRVFCRLGNFSASVLLLHEVLAQLDILDHDRVYQMPKNDLLLVAKATNAMATCFMGEISLKMTKSKSFLGLQPFVYRNGWIPYEESKIENKCLVPQKKDEMKVCKKAILR